MMSEDLNNEELKEAEEVKSESTQDKIIDVLSKLTSTDIDKLEKMAKGEFTEDVKKDKAMIEYLRTVDSLFGGNGRIFKNDEAGTRQTRYETYDEMEDSVAYVSSALDILSDDATQPDEDGVVIHITSENSKVQTLVENMVKNLELEERVSKWARVIAKYGDFFVEVQGEKGTGVRGVLDSHYPGHIERKEIDGDLAAFVDTTQSEAVRAIKAPWEFVHFRHKGDIYRKKEAASVGLDNKTKSRLSGSYGQSVLQPAIKVFTQLRFVENMIILSRMTNSIRRNIFMINVGDVSADKSVETVQLYANLLKKDITLDLDKGAYDSKKQTIKYDEDIFLPVSDTKNDVRVEQVGGDVNIGEQYDLEYLLNKLFAALKIPKAYLNYEQDLNARSTLIQLDVRYARSVARIQQTLVGGLMRLAKIHLAYHGMDASNVDLDIQLSSVSSIESEIRRQEREQNLSNAMSFMDVMEKMKASLSGADPMDPDAPAVPTTGKEAPVDMEYAAYYVAKELLGIKEVDMEKMFGFKLERFHDKPVKNKSESIKENKVYINSDSRAPLPGLENDGALKSIRESFGAGNNSMEVQEDELNRIS